DAPGHAGAPEIAFGRVEIPGPDHHIRGVFHPVEPLSQAAAGDGEPARPYIPQGSARRPRRAEIAEVAVVTDAVDAEHPDHDSGSPSSDRPARTSSRQWR